jgi:hypothetical protein
LINKNPYTTGAGVLYFIKNVLTIFFTFAAGSLDVQNYQKYSGNKYEQNARYKPQVINLHGKKASPRFPVNNIRIASSMTEFAQIFCCKCSNTKA